MRVAQLPPPPRFEATIAATPDHVRALEAALVAARAGEERFRGLVESIQAIPYIANWDEPGTILYISPQVEALLGYAPEQWYEGEDPWAPNIHPDDRDRVLAEAKRTFEAEEEFHAEYRIIAVDGRVVSIAERETHVRDAAGKPCFSHGVMFDITRLKTVEERLMAAEAALREERDLARRYFDVARTLLLALDADGCVRQLNHHGHELLGHPAGALIGLVLLRGLPSDREAAGRTARAVADTVTARLAQPFAIAGQSLRVRASVGVAVGPHDAADADGLLRHADAAMYRSKGRSSAPAGGR
jgi:PAS domain S-box-containing protein